MPCTGYSPTMCGNAPIPRRHDNLHGRAGYPIAERIAHSPCKSMGACSALQTRNGRRASCAGCRPRSALPSLPLAPREDHCPAAGYNGDMSRPCGQHGITGTILGSPTEWDPCSSTRISQDTPQGVHDALCLLVGNHPVQADTETAVLGSDSYPFWQYPDIGE